MFHDGQETTLRYDHPMRRAALFLLVSSAVVIFCPLSNALPQDSGAAAPSRPILVARSAMGIDFVHVGGERDAKRFIVEENGSGVALFDYDGDGDLDVYFVNGSRVEAVETRSDPKLCCNALYRNDGEWRFLDVTAAAGVGDAGWGQGVAVGDVDGDGDRDLFVANYGADALYLNRGDGTFENGTAKAGLGDAGWGAAAAFADFDLDGDLDLYVSRYLELDLAHPPTEACEYKNVQVACGPIGFAPQPDLLYENQDGTFVEVSKSAGLGDLEPEFGLGVLVTDLDADGRPDLVVANDSGANFLLHNLGPENLSEGADRTIRFEEMAWLSGIATSQDGRFQAGMGVDAGDADGDGRLDLFFSHFMNDHNTLYLSSGTLLFRDASYPSGLGGPSRLRMSWGTLFFDADQDGHVDLYVGNGHLYPEVAAVPSESYGQEDQLFLGDGAGRFTDASSRLQGTENTVSRGVASGDLDGDGDLDVVVSQLDRPPLLLENRTESNAWLSLQPGAEIEAVAGSVRLTAPQGAAQLRRVGSSGSYASASDPTVHFGLGTAQGDFTVEILDGQRTLRWRGLVRGVSYRLLDSDIKTGIKTGLKAANHPSTPRP